MSVLANLAQARKQFVEEVLQDENVIQYIDVKMSVASTITGAAAMAPMVAPVGAYTKDTAVFEFLYETESGLYMLMCNLFGQKVKHVKLNYADLQLKIVREFKVISFNLKAKDGWYYVGNVHEMSVLDLIELANRHHIPVVEKKWGYFHSLFMNYPIAALYSIPLMIILVVFLLLVIFNK